MESLGQDLSNPAYVDKVKIFSDYIEVIKVNGETREMYEQVGNHHNFYCYGRDPKIYTKSNGACENTFSKTQNTCIHHEYRLAKENYKYSEYTHEVVQNGKSDLVNFYFYILLGKKKKTQLEDSLTSLSPHDVVRMISIFVKSEFFLIFKNTVSKLKSKTCWEINQIVMKIHQFLFSILSTIFCALVMYIYHVCNFVFCNLSNIVYLTQSDASPLLHHLTITQVHIEPTFYLSGGRC